MSQSDRGSRPFDHIVGYINTFSCFLSNIMYFQIFSLLVLPNLYYLKPTAAPKSATENHHFWEASIASHEKWLPLSWAKQRKFPSLHTPYWCTQKCHRKPPLLSSEHCEPIKKTSSLLSKVREVSLSTYPLLVHPKVPQKTTTFERQSDVHQCQCWNK